MTNDIGIGIDLAEMAACVARGASLLDERKPGWVAEIIDAELCMSICDECILGQVYGYYTDGLRSLEAPEVRPTDECDADLTEDAEAWSINHGFTLWYKRQHEAWDALADLWRAEIRRRAEGGPTP